MRKVQSVLSACPFIGMLMFGIASAHAQDKKPESSGSPVVARTGDSTITMEEVDAKALASDMKLAQSLYDARLAAIDDILMERAFSKEAAAKGIPAEVLLSQKINEQQKPVTDQDIQAYYNANSARMKGKTLEQVTGQIKNYLVSRSEQMAKKQLLDQVKKDANVHISLEPPRLNVPIAANDPIMGPPGAKVTIVEFSDFQ